MNRVTARAAKAYPLARKFRPHSQRSSRSQRYGWTDLPPMIKVRFNAGQDHRHQRVHQGPGY
jgi:hypothetical protein